ncbi:MAG TPA: glycosyltransferase family 2 protein [Streptosporangiaceae bacterium]|jgi:GT2 family glycosyltransferase
MAPDVAIVIVTYNSAHVIADLLDSIPAALDGLSADVVVVDNASADGTAELVAARGDCRLVRSANTGYAGGINRGVRAAMSAEAILVLNPDVRLGDEAVPALLAALREPHAGIAAPQLRSPAGGLEPSLRREPTLPRALGLTRTGLAVFAEQVTRAADYASPRTADWATGAVLAISRKCWDLLGGWDESYFLYSEETDFALRARDAGLLTWYTPDAVAVHAGGQSGRSHATHAMQVINRVRLYRRRHRAAPSWLYFLLILAGELSRAARGRPRSAAAAAALLRPSRRPGQLGCRDRLMPR